MRCGADPRDTRRTRYVVTEYGTASLLASPCGKSACDDCIAHPVHRESLLAAAKFFGYAYPDQIYVRENAGYPMELEAVKSFRNGLEVLFRPIKPSDEDMMRRLFYQFSDE